MLLSVIFNTQKIIAEVIHKISFSYFSVLAEISFW